MVKTGWKKEMDALYKKTTKNWQKTGGKAKKALGTNCNVNLKGKND